MDILQQIRSASGPTKTVGLDDETIKRFLITDSSLSQAISDAFTVWKTLDGERTYRLSDADLIASIYDGWCCFYPKETRNPYVPLASKGPWIVTLHGAIIHDNGGYGMLGLGHNPEVILNALSKKQVMANIMTPSLSHRDLISALRKEIGHTRQTGCPYAQFLMMNSGSEGNSVADRIIDVFTGNKHGDKSLIVGISLKNSFHGRTFKPAIWTDSSAERYKETKCYALVTLRNSYSRTVKANDCEELQKVFQDCINQGAFVEAIFMEAVMGEGSPGTAITPAFYDLARKLTLENESMLLIDSVQAGFRCQGVLSITDYPGFQNSAAPDFEVFSKAVNGGQFPVSIVALSARAAAFYREGIYGNTMTGNPRACDVSVAVLENVPRLRENICKMGEYAIRRFTQVKENFPEAVTAVTGTGLLYAVHLDKKRFPVVAVGGAEFWLRTQGLGVVHGGENALRFTPHFAVTEKEIEMQAEMVEKFLIVAKNCVPQLKAIGALEKAQARHLTGQSSASGDLSPSVSSPVSSPSKIVRTYPFLATFELKGHLFDTQFVNEALTEIEKHKALARFDNLRLGATISDETELSLEVSAPDDESLAKLVEKIKAIASSKGCKCVI